MGITESELMFLDPYDRPARLYPSLLVFVPLAVLLVCLYGEENILASSILSILAFCGVAYAFSRFARNAGKRLQEKLLIKWGGSPTVQLLRHKNRTIDVHTKEKYHSILSARLGKQMPTVEDENNNLASADELYRAAEKWLTTQTRDTKVFPLVFKENVAFGFQRNALGLRWIGIGVSITCMTWVFIHEKVFTFTKPYFVPEHFLSLPPVALVSITVTFVMIGLWILFINESALRRTGFAYAERLLESCDTVQSNLNSPQSLS